MRKNAMRMLLAMVAVCGLGFQQQEPRDSRQDGSVSQDAVVRIFVNLVQVDAVVSDGKGRMVKDLQAEDFELLQDGKPQRITNFSFVSLLPASVSLLPASSTPAPRLPPPSRDRTAPPPPPVRLRPEQVRRTIALVVDDLGLSFESMARTRDAAKKFVEETMQPGDLVAVIRSGAGIGALQQFTSDKSQLLAAIDRLRWNPMSRQEIGTFAPLVVSEEESEADDAAGEASFSGPQDLDSFRQEVFSVGTLGALNYVVGGLREMPGRKSVVLLSDGFKLLEEQGFNTRIMDSLDSLLDMANRASVVIYTMDCRGLPTLSLTAADKIGDLRADRIWAARQRRSDDYFESQDGLSTLAEETGGLFIHNTNDLGDGLAQVMEDQAGYYLLGYIPDESTFTSKSGEPVFHKIEVKVKRPGLKVRTRKGFYGVEDSVASAAPATRGEKLLAALTSPFASGEMKIRLTSLFGNDPNSGMFMRSLLHVQGKDLAFVIEKDGWRKGVLDILAVTFADNGRIVDQIDQSFTIRTRGKNYEQILKEGLVCTINVPLKNSGAYQLRAAVRDSLTDRVGSASQFVEVPDLKKGRLALSGILLRGVEQDPRGTASGGAASVLASKTAAGDADQAAANTSPAVRRFQKGETLLYGMIVYNAKLDGSTRRPQLETQIRVFRRGRPVYVGQVWPLDAAAQGDARRVLAAGKFALGKEFEPDDYVLQIIVNDRLTKSKYGISTQWIDFEVIS